MIFRHAGQTCISGGAVKLIAVSSGSKDIYTDLNYYKCGRGMKV